MSIIVGEGRKIPPTHPQVSTHTPAFYRVCVSELLIKSLPRHASLIFSHKFADDVKARVSICPFSVGRMGDVLSS